MLDRPHISMIQPSHNRDTIMEKIVKTELIEEYLRENKLSKAKFCKNCKISPTTLTRILNNQNVSLLAVFRITRVLGIYLNEIFN